MNKEEILEMAKKALLQHVPKERAIEIITDTMHGIQWDNNLIYWIEKHSSANKEQRKCDFLHTFKVYHKGTEYQYGMAIEGGAYTCSSTLRPPSCYLIPEVMFERLKTNGFEITKLSENEEQIIFDVVGHEAVSIRNLKQEIQKQKNEEK